MQFYVKDWLSSTLGMSAESKGAYIDMLAWSWDNGPLPNDETSRARIAGLSIKRFRKVWPQLQLKWSLSGSVLVNARLESQRASLRAYRDKQAEKGRKSAESRQPRLNHGSATVEPVLPSGSNREATLPSAICILPSAVDQETCAEADASTPALVFPTAGNPKAWVLTHEQIGRWQEGFAGVDVSAECRKALMWVQASPERKKTVKGMPRFLVAWLGRTNDSTRQPIKPTTRPRTLGPAYGESWDAECGRVHNFDCAGENEHKARMAQARTA